MRGVGCILEKPLQLSLKNEVGGIKLDAGKVAETVRCSWTRGQK